ncbi:MAG: indole-3-glycerol phosphate synthase TrpC [Candidatus Marinamargulisbacteria bacterium]
MSILSEIIHQKNTEIAALKQARPVPIDPRPLRRSLLAALQNSRDLGLIAEVKKASPSKGLIYTSFDPVSLAQKFETHGATCISVLTDEVFFKGHRDYLMAVKTTVSIPVLRKDFILDPLQVAESDAMGADVILLILDILSVDQANELIDAARIHGLDVLIEVHSEDAVKKLRDINDKPMVGINNRDLHTFSCDRQRAIDYSSAILAMDSTIQLIAESGYDDASQLADLTLHGIHGVLIGEGLSYSPNLLEWFHDEN